MKPPQLLEHWYKTTDWILDKCDRFPKQTRFTVAGRIAALVLDTLERITEAAYSKEKRMALLQVNLHLEKLRLLFRLCYDRRYISPAQYEFVQREINTAGRMCGGWLKTCDA
ncbi:MAG: diversity-generating retroelement protein Avd [Saprospiraceae bacterium]|nr:diversity-generating retroelement protein Avd [Saprospiraceae bacterium]